MPTDNPLFDPILPPLLLTKIEAQVLLAGLVNLANDDGIEIHGRTGDQAREMYRDLLITQAPNTWHGMVSPLVTALAEAIMNA
jgi:hypothetical protein